MSLHLIDLFSNDFHQFSQNIYTGISRDVNRIDKDAIMNTDEETLVESIMTHNKLSHLEVNFEGRQLEPQEKSGKEHDTMFNEELEVRYNSFLIEIPYSGPSVLWELQPSTKKGMLFQAEVRDDIIRFEVDDIANNIDYVNSRIRQNDESIKINTANLNDEIDNLNPQIEEHARKMIKQRKEEIGTLTQNIALLGIPLKKNTSIPQTFAIPTAKAIKTIPKITNKSGDSTSPTPTLSDPIYEDILQTIHDVGKVMERLPKIYKDRDENDIRDLFLLYLEPRYTSAGGETFNGGGKTDILIRHENSNVFIAEYKFWKGAGQFSSAIDQLYRYLTWRDSKTDIVVLCQNKDLTAVLLQIKSTVESHENYVKSLPTKDDTWMSFIMHFPGDTEKEIKLAVQVFHVP